jgi:hypothetical protein
MNNKRTDKKKVFSAGLSLFFHLLFCIAAINMIFITPSVSAPNPPMLVHVKIDSRPYSSSIGNQVPKTEQKPIVTKPEKKMAETKKQMVPKQEQSRPKKSVVTEAKKAPKAMTSARDVLKDRKVSTRSVNTSAVKRVSRIVSSEVQGMQGRANIQSTMQNYQGVEPYLPFEHDGKGEDIKAYLGYELYTYEDPEDGEKYFKLSVKVEELPGSLPPLPKEVVFLVDTSNSIGADLLAKFTKGLEECLNQLGGSDKFNIISFNNRIVKMQEESVFATPDEIQKAKNFLESRQANQSTDLFDTILKTIRFNNPLNPAYLFLLSDGQPTQGVKNSQQIINEITRTNQGKVAIFGFGAGSVNKYFMNFVSFTNRGWSEYTNYLKAEDGVIDMYRHIKDPVLINLRYYATGLNEQEIYPKVLPDLFKGAEFILYGQYKTQDKFLFQLRGDGHDGLKQYVVDDNLSNGHKGDRSIAEEWAIRKIYHLIGQLEYDKDNQTIIQEVERLAQKFDLQIPQYSAK